MTRRSSLILLSIPRDAQTCSGITDYVGIGDVSRSSLCKVRGTGYLYNKTQRHPKYGVHISMHYGVYHGGFNYDLYFRILAAKSEG